MTHRKQVTVDVGHIYVVNLEQVSIMIHDYLLRKNYGRMNSSYCTKEEELDISGISYQT